MDCAAAKPKMEALASGTLPERERALVDQHVATCEGCRLELELVRAIGSQEKPPETGEADWTLDRIFGAEGAESAGSAENPASSPGGSVVSSPSAASAPSVASAAGPAAPDGPSFSFDDGAAAAVPAPGAAPDPGVPHRLSVEGQVGEAAASPAAEPSREQLEDPSTWSFESSDAKPGLVPPEKSLFFAEEALSRRKDADRRKSSTLRLVLWTAGGVVGAVLLALSTWVAFHMTQPSGDRDDASRLRPRASARRPSAARTQEPPAQAAALSRGVAPAQEVSPAQRATPAQEVPPEQGVPPAQGVADSDRAPAPAEGAAAASVGANASSKEPEPPAPAPQSPTQLAPARVPQWQPAATAPRAARPKSQQPLAAGVTRPTAQAGTGPLPSASASSEPPPSAASAAPTQASAPEAAAAARSNPDPGTVPAAVTPVETPGPMSPRPAQAVPAAQPALVPAPAQAPQAPAQSAQASPASAPAPPAPEVATPIDRLHLATVAAEERGDVVGLRQLRSTWKDFMTKMGVGPERARAKREYADCLWAIQSLTGKRTDQKDALAAYREYILSAPAGGADNRSVSRLRQLEDALSERR